MRYLVLIVALLFIAMLGTLTALDIGRYGLNVLNAAAILIMVMFCTGIVGALRHPPPS